MDVPERGKPETITIGFVSVLRKGVNSLFISIYRPEGFVVCDNVPKDCTQNTYSPNQILRDVLQIARPLQLFFQFFLTLKTHLRRTL